MDINDILKSIEDATTAFKESIDPSQKAMFLQVENVLQKLDISNGKILPTAANFRAISSLKKLIQKAVINPKYKEAVKNYIESFTALSNGLQTYFKTITDEKFPDKILELIKYESIDTTLTSLTEAGINANVSEGIRQILKQNITGGGSVNDLRNQLRDYILTNDKGKGALERYTAQITTDALNQYSGQYMQALTQNLGLKWNMYVGSNLTTTREFCEYLTKKKYVYEDELPGIIAGTIDGHECKLNDKTELPNGMIDGTNVSNFQVYRGGYSCGHSYVPVAENFVPKSIRIAAYTKYGIAYDSNGFMV